MSRKFYAPTTFFVQLIFYLTNIFYEWPLLRASGIGGMQFAGDLALTLELADCNGKTCPNFLYGETLAFLIRKLHLTSVSLQLLASILILLFLLTVSLLTLQTSNITSVIVVNLVALSPATSLLLERVNIDLLIFVLVYSATILFERKKYLSPLSILLFASAIKFYALIPFVYVLCLYWKRETNEVRKIGILGISTISILAIIIDLLHKVNTLPIYWSSSFGAAIWIVWLKWILGNYFEFSLEISAFGILVVSLVTITLFAYVVRKVHVREVLEWRIKRKLNLLLVTGLGCYLIGVSFDYRIIFILLPLAISSSRITIKLNFLILISAYFSTTNYGLQIRFVWPLIQAVGDLALFFLVLGLVHVVIQGLATAGKNRNIIDS